jgi:hypothetical protein
MRWLVGLLLIGLFCIQCIPQGGSIASNVVIAKSMAAPDSPQRLVQFAQTDHVALLKLCRQRYADNVRDYACTFIKQERINGALGGEQEIGVKFMDSPFSVAMDWRKNAPLGDKIIYVEGKHDDNMIVRPKGSMLQMLTGGAVLRKPGGDEAMRSTLRPVSVFGFSRGLRDLIAVYEQAAAAGELDQRFGGYADVEGRKTLVLERYLPAGEHYPAWKTLVYIDVERLLPVCIEGWDWDKRLSCRYVYKDVRFNIGLTDGDFLPESNGIKMPKSQ